AHERKGVRRTLLTCSAAVNFDLKRYMGQKKVAVDKALDLSIDSTMPETDKKIIDWDCPVPSGVELARFSSAQHSVKQHFPAVGVARSAFGTATCSIDEVLADGGREAHPAHHVHCGVRIVRWHRGHGHADGRVAGDDTHHVPHPRRPPRHGQRRPQEGYAHEPREVRRGHRHFSRRRASLEVVRTLRQGEDI
ncbi:unnamed protein product, partial [Phaeothamnion confervicola]